MRTPNRITRHPNSGFIAHYGDEAIPLKSMSTDERDHVLSIMVDRYNLHDPADGHPEEVHA